MPDFTFAGTEESIVGLPDGSTVLASPGEVVTLPMSSPGPLWVAAPSKKAPKQDAAPGTDTTTPKD